MNQKATGMPIKNQIQKINIKHLTIKSLMVFRKFKSIYKLGRNNPTV